LITKLLREIGLQSILTFSTNRTAEVNASLMLKRVASFGPAHLF